MTRNQEKNAIDPILDEIGERKSAVDCTGLTGSARAYFVYRMYLRDPRPMVVVLPKAPDAERFMADLEFFTGGLSWPVLYFPPYHILPFKFLSYHGETAAARIRALFEMMEYSLSAPPLVVTTAGAMAQKVMPKTVLSEHCELLAENEDIEIDRLAEKLNAGGYERSMIVEEPGDYCVRGGIVDIFSPLYDSPIRIELFGDMVESLRFFSPVNQRTLKRVSEAVIAPCRETVLVQSELAEIASRVRAQGARMELPVSQVREIVDRVKNEGVFPGIEILLPMMYSQMDTFMDYAPERSLYVLMEPRDLQRASDDVYEQARNNYAASLQDKSFGIEPESLFLPWERLEAALEKERPVRVKSLAMVRPDEEGEVSFRASFATSDNSELQGQLKARKDSERLFIPLAQWLEEKTSAGMNALVVCASKSRAQRADTILKPYGVATELLEGFDPRRLSKNSAAGRAYLCIGGLASGFVWPEESLAVVTDVEIFGKRRRRKPAAPKVRTGLLSFDELQQDDLVVHAEHGIGQYHGLVKLELNGTGNEFLLLRYRDNDKLYLPVDRMNLIQKYMGVEGVVPVLDKMGGKSWERVRSKVKKSVEKIAAELLRLYASRKVREGWAFSDLTEEMREFEAAFPFEETPDQLKAIEDVFSDMTAPTPMDRLICGDVGYGKTEVALRASFLSAFNGKQVAMLVPTTVLAEQHCATFSKRFEPYPVTVACLSRFRPAKQQKEIVEGLKSGAVDIVIGTHRLVQKDVGFKDLGLLILDEEQRFGVKHKEKIKKIKSTVDVLALSATPIPRTLHMSLMGIRDISVLSTPPEYRRAIVTYISEFDDAIVKDAIRKELARGGQIFFVHNNIFSIGSMAQRLRELVPEVRLGVAHGRLEESKLEKVMLSFMERELDMLLCTTIIESGLDVGTANTIIVNRADRFGLSQIYQLRGRVGRSDEQAYAYLFVPKESKLTKDAVKRLKVLMEHSDLGAGFQIAMSDLKIRGGGTILGASQSGHIAAVGYDMFLQLMEQAMAEQKGEEIKDALEPEINVTISTYLPETYIPDIDQRLATYRRLARMNALKEISDFKAEMEDRFGPLPPEASNLLIKIMLRVLCIQAGIRRLDLNEEQLALYFSEPHQKNPLGILEMVADGSGGFSISPDSVLTADLKKTGAGGVMSQTKNILKEIRQRVNG